MTLGELNKLKKGKKVYEKRSHDEYTFFEQWALTGATTIVSINNSCGDKFDVYQTAFLDQFDTKRHYNG